MPFLVYEDPKTGQEKSFEVNAGQSVLTLGRNQGNDLRLESASISRQHARIEFTHGVATIVDQGSSNGTHVNGTKVIKTILSSGDFIRLGEVELQYFDQMPQGYNAQSQTFNDYGDQPEYLQTLGSSFEFSDYQPYDSAASLDHDTHTVDDSTRLPSAFGQPGGNYAPPPNAGFNEGSFSQNYGNNYSAPENNYSPPSGNNYDWAPDTQHDDVGSLVNHNEYSSSYQSPASDVLGSDAFGGDALGNDAFGGPPSRPPASPRSSQPELQALSKSKPPIPKPAGPPPKPTPPARTSNSGLPPVPTPPSSVASSPSRATDVSQSFRDEESDYFTTDSEADWEDEPRSVDNGRQQTRLAPPEVAKSLAEMSRPQVETRYSDSPGGDAQELEALRRERDELLNIVEGRADDINRSLSEQIHRMRSERDKLINERRKLNKSIADLTQQLQAAPKEEELVELEDEIEATRAAKEELAGRVVDLENELDAVTQRNESLEDSIARLDDAFGEELVARFKDEEISGDLFAKVMRLVSLYKAEVANSANLTEGEVAARADREAAAGEISELKETIKSRDARIIELSEENDQIQADFEEAKQAFESFKSEAKSFQEKIELLEASNDELKRTLEARPNHLEFQEVSDEVEQLRASLLLVKDERDSLTRERNDLLTKVDELNLKVDEVEQKSRQLSARIDVLVTERDTLKQEKVAFARETDYLQVERKRLQEETTKLREDLRESGKTARKHKRVFDELSSDLRQLVAQNQRLTDELRIAEGRLADAPDQSAVDELTDELQLLRDTNIELKEEVSSVTRDLGTVSQERNNLQAKIESLTAELDSLNNTIKSGESIQAQLVELKQKGRQDAETIDNLKNDVESIQAKLSAAQQEVAAKNQDIARIEAENADLRHLANGEDAGSSTKLVNLKNQLAEAERKLFEVIIEKDRLEDQLAAMQK